MRITKINIPESSQDGLREINMSHLSKVVLITGRNGSGKTRIINKILSVFGSKPKKSDLIKYKTQINGLENNIRQYKKQIETWEKQLNNENVQQAKNNRNNIESYQNSIIIWEESINSMIASINWSQIETNEESDQYSAVRFVPTDLKIKDCDSIAKKELHEYAQKVDSVGVSFLPNGAFAKIQVVQDKWFNATHQESSVTKEQKDKAVEDYNKLKEIINNFLGTDITRNINDQATLFGFPLGQSKLSDGQKVLLQLCIAIYSQETKLEDLILILDEPENHLHPSIIVEIIEKLEKCVTNGQLWIATHSIPLLAHFDHKYLWFVENGNINYSGKTPENVLNSLLGDNNEIAKLRNFIGLPDQFAICKHAFEALFEPKAIITGTNDPQTLQIRNELQSKSNNGILRVLDYGAGKGRLIGNLLDLDMQNRESLLSQIDYIAYDEFTDDKETCINTLQRVYGSVDKRYYNDLSKLFTDYNSETFDIVIMCNVLHEIDPKDWIKLFKKDGIITTCLKDNGILLMVEDCHMPNVELAYNKGFLVIDTPEIKILFNIPENMKDFKIIASKNDRLKAHHIPKEYLIKINADSRKRALLAITEKAKREIIRIRSSSDKNYENGLMHGFWTQQLANAYLNLDEL